MSELDRFLIILVTLAITTSAMVVAIRWKASLPVFGLVLGAGMMFVGAALEYPSEFSPITTVDASIAGASLGIIAYQVINSRTWPRE